jgi:excisionase family DNA binding protein
MCNAQAMPNEMTSLDLVGTAEAARMLGHVDKSTITRWVHDGRLEVAHRLPGKHGALLFRRADIEALAAERAAEAS